jgi:hypothetical protein
LSFHRVHAWNLASSMHVDSSIYRQIYRQRSRAV